MASYSFEVLKNRDFRILCATRLFGTMALQAQAVIVGWQIYSLTHSTFKLGLVGLAEAVPAISCSLIAGHIVDISRPYRIFLACIAALVCNMCFLYLVASGMIALPDDVRVVCIFAGVFFSGIARSFLSPSSFALQPRIVPRQQIPSASAWLTSAFQTGIIAGPAIAGIIYGGYGPPVAWLMPVSLMCVELVILFGISQEHREFRGQEKREPSFVSIREGARFLITNHLLLCVMALDMFAVLFGGAVSMLPAVADQVLHVGSQGLGLLRAAPAMGAVAVTLWFAVKPLKVMRGALLLAAVAGFGVSIIVFGFSQWFWVSMLCLAASGAFDSVSMLIRHTLVQWLTPEGMRGRVSAVSTMFIISSNEIGAFESGLAAHFLGLTPSIVLGGIGTLIVVAVTAVIYPKLRATVVSAD
ncbi:MAG TPA: MFS transporter [Rickettsiales bacterium]|nr:MFS transporter [Rickettsiales bacterium]